MNLNSLKISVIIPVCNEEENVLPLVNSLETVLKEYCKIRGEKFEVIFIDDGSSDQTESKLLEIVRMKSFTKAVFLRKNFGKSAALAVGFHEANGEVIITMDGDLQDEPKEIPNFLAKIEEGFDLVSGWKKRRNDPFEKVIFSKIFNSIACFVTGVKLHDFNCGFKAYRSWCAKKIYLNGNLYRFLPVFVALQGGKIAELSVQHNKRTAGKSKYGFSRYYHGFFDLMTIALFARFFYKPLYFFGAIAIPLLLGALVLGTYLVGNHLVWLFGGIKEFQLVNRPLLSICFGLGGFGINFLLVGLLAEFTIQISGSNQSRYLYNIERVVTGADQRDTHHGG